MAAIFRPSANLAATLSLLGMAALLVGGHGWWWILAPNRLRASRRLVCRSTGAIQPRASCRRFRDRLPLLPHFGGGVVQRRPAADLYLHDLPFPDLDQRGPSGAGAAKPRRRQADRLEPDHRPAGLRLFQSQHSHRQGRRLLELSRRGGPDAAQLQGEDPHDAVLPGLPSRTPARICGRRIRSTTPNGSGPPTHLRRRR